MCELQLHKVCDSQIATCNLRVATDATRKRVPSLFASRKWAFCIPFPILHCRKLRIGPFASRKPLLHLAHGNIMQYLKCILYPMGGITMVQAG
ncbi:hypothetical protein NDU88_005501 [Pleurodeles waltl]|uniref:Uncharacterized protein n=1 Tax=Pleurodeles waltl TaxID=8319 RepID=A0AAV7W9Q6_PLEWA|nr:hypothetical protein NDU88_005501 [Pleurodeles waltl]